MGVVRVELGAEAVEGIAQRLERAIRALLRSDNRVVRAEARYLAHLRAIGGARALGFASFGDLARERLQVAPRTAQERVALHEMLTIRPAVEQAFLEGALTACQVLTLRPLLSSGPDALTLAGERHWIERARALSVRQLRAEVAAARGAGAGGASAMDPIEAGLHDPGRVVSFRAPAPAVMLWAHALQTARRMIGREAAVHECVDAILAESTRLGALDPLDSGEAPVEPREALPKQRERGDPPPETCARTAEKRFPLHVLSLPARPDLARGAATGKRARRAARRARRTLREIARELRYLDDLIENGEPRDAEDTVLRLQALAGVGRPLRVLLGRALRDLRETDGVSCLGYRSIQEFATDGLGFSERTARGLLAEAGLLATEPVLAEAFATAKLGIGQAFLIREVVAEFPWVEAVPHSRTPTRAETEALLRAHADRAAEITHRQLRREVLFLRRLQEFFPAVAMSFRGPLPQHGLEATLFRELEARDVRPGTAEAELALRDLALWSGASRDPAENPIVMRRLEVLLDMLILTAFEDLNGAWGDAQVTPRQTSARYDPLPPASEPAGRDPAPAPARQTSARVIPEGRVRFWAPTAVAQSWDAAIRGVRAREGPVPAWVAAAALIADALNEWERHDPQTRPTEWRILERDGYLCQAPGCTERRRLEVHHIVFRSRQGGDGHTNLVVLCHVHHHHILHAGVLDLTGAAPQELQWSYRHRLMPRVLRGERLLVDACRVLPYPAARTR